MELTYHLRLFRDEDFANNIKTIIGSSIVLILVLFPYKVSANLLNNPGFEGASDTVAEDWSRSYSSDGATATFRTESSIAHNGKSQAVTTISNDGGRLFLYQNVTIHPGRIYRAEVWVSSGSEESCTADFRVKAVSGAYNYRIAGRSRITVDASWRKVSFLVVPLYHHSETNHHITMGPVEEGMTCYFDDASLTDVTEDELGALEASLEHRQPIPASFFGLHINEGHQRNWPSIGQKTIRLWDNAINWSWLEPEKGVPYDWERFDIYVNSLIKRNDPSAKIVYNLGMTPGWANGNQHRSKPPLNLDDWEYYVRQVVTKYKGRIDAYEIWNEVDYKKFYSGTTEELVALAKRAYDVIKAIDPAAIVLTPSFTYNGLTHLERYLELGGGEAADAFAYHHYYGGKQADLEDTFNDMLISLAIHDIIKRAGYQDWPVYITELAPRLEVRENLEDEDCIPEPYTDMQVRASIAQGMILSYLFGNDSYYFYFWESANESECRVPLSLANNETLTTGGEAYKTMVGWLTGKRIRSFDNLLATDSAAPTTITLDRGPAYKAILAWSRNSAINSYVPPNGSEIKAVSYLDGRTTPYTGGSLSIGPDPVLIEYDNSSQQALSGLWRGEGSGIDSSGNQFDATETQVTYIPGRDGQAFSTPANGRLSVPANDLLDPNDGLTISLWYRQSQIRSYDQYLVSKAAHNLNTGYLLFIEKETNLPKLRLYDGNNGSWMRASVTLPSAPTLNTWHHLAATFDGASLKLYLNGVLQQTKELGSHTVLPSSGNLTLASRFDGDLDEIRLYNTSLNSDEINALANCIGHWTLDTIAVSNSINGEDALPDGSVTGNITPSTDTIGDSGGSLNLDGIYGSKISISNHEEMSTDTFSVSLWMKNEKIFHNGSSDYIPLASRSSWSDKTGFTLLGQSNGMLTFRTYDGSEHGWMNREINTPFNQMGDWTHVVAVSDNNEMRLYINGTLVKSKPIDSPMAINHSNNLILGSNFKGLLDEVRYYQKPLSTRQVEWLYFEEKP
jgi:hypothetical protein